MSFSKPSWVPASDTKTLIPPSFNGFAANGHIPFLTMTFPIQAFVLSSASALRFSDRTALGSIEVAKHDDKTTF
jgi:hypothetical protein